MPSLMAGNRLYLLKSATMSCLEPATGNKIWAHNLSGQPARASLDSSLLKKHKYINSNCLYFDCLL